MNKIIIFIIFSLCFFQITGLPAYKRVEFAFSPLGALSTSSQGGWIIYENESFKFDVETAEKAIQMASWKGVSIMRILPFSQWWVKSKKEMFQPFKYEEESGKYNLKKWNPDYWRILKDFVLLCNIYNIKVMFCVFDTCGLHKNQPGLMRNPWFNNKQGIKHFVSGGQHSARYVEKVLFELEKFDNIMYEFCNEYSYIDKAKAIRFAIDVFYQFKNAGIPAHHISFGACVVPPYDNSILLAHLKASRNICRESLYGESGKVKIFRPIHGMCYGQSLQNVLYYFWLSFFISNDGDYWYGVGCDYIEAKPGRNRPKAIELYGIAKQVLTEFRFDIYSASRIIIEHCPKNFDPNCQKKKLRKMILPYFERFNRYPSNYKKYRFRYYLFPYLFLLVRHI
jgi:hypothetical protein